MKLRFLEFFQEDNGIYSAMRLVFVVWSLGLLVVWGNASLRKNNVDELPSSVVALVGVFMTGKVTQKIAENNNVPNNPVNKDCPPK